MKQLYSSLWRSGALIRFMFAARHRGNLFGSVLGQLWVLLNPLAQMLIYYFLIAVVFRRGATAGIHPFIMVMAGITHYVFFQQTVQRSAESVLGAEGLLMQVPLEPAIFTAVMFLEALRDLAATLVIFWISYLWIGPGITWRIAAYPIALGLLLAMSWSLGLLFATLQVFFRDMRQLLSIALRILLYLSPVVYMVSFVPESYRWLYLLNPIACLFAIFQWSLLNGPAPAIWQIAVLLSVVLALAMVAHVVYQRLKIRFTKAF